MFSPAVNNQKKPKRKPKETHSLSFHPTVWKWISERAREDYGGNISAAIAGLVIYDRAVGNAKRIKGRSHHHYLTPGLANESDLLEATIREIESSDPGVNAVTWLEVIFTQQRQSEFDLGV